jgi:hypothetical protein
MAVSSGRADGPTDHQPQEHPVPTDHAPELAALAKRLADAKEFL